MTLSPARLAKPLSYLQQNEHQEGVKSIQKSDTIKEVEEKIRLGYKAFLSIKSRENNKWRKVNEHKGKIKETDLKN